MSITVLEINDDYDKVKADQFWEVIYTLPNCPIELEDLAFSVDIVVSNSRAKEIKEYCMAVQGFSDGTDCAISFDKVEKYESQYSI
ncbi:MAG: hypothetical protein BV456_00600 [Thermoplasmata archaeon M8B2D]|nr:MAG: hypothetical protein BV456_00600 [Thermoplasmata archaeon M8B2D]